MAARLKVYRTTAGFYETVVAAANQGAALKAWGVRQNLFAEDAAAVETDADIVKAAVAHPDQPLRRPIGSKSAFTLDPDTPAPPRGGKAKTKPKPDRKALDAAEAALGALQERQGEEAAELERRLDALKAEQTEAEERWKQAREAAETKLRAAKRAYDKASR